MRYTAEPLAVSSAAKGSFEELRNFTILVDVQS
jgi:hypothetical protein